MYIQRPPVNKDQFQVFLEYQTTSKEHCGFKSYIMQQDNAERLLQKVEINKTILTAYYHSSLTM